MAETNFKGLLQIHCQKAKVELPKYTCTQRMQGSSLVFLANLSVLGRNFTSEGEFRTKKQAEKNAAQVALRELGILGAELIVKSPENDPARVQAVIGESAKREVGQSCGEMSSVSTLPAGEVEDVLPASISSPEVCKKASTPEPQISCSEIHRAFPSNTQAPVATMSHNPVSFKNVLQERAQKMGLAFPRYETTQEGEGFVCTVIFNEQCFKSKGCSPSKKLAQQNAAAIAIKVLTAEQGTDRKSPILESNAHPNIQTPQTTMQTAVATSENMFDAKVSYKNLLQENCQQRGNKPPAYSTTWEGSGFISIVHFGDITASSKMPYNSKKQAEQMAAREALLMIGVSNPEQVYINKETKKNKLKRKFAPRAGFQRTSWVHFRGGQGLQPSEWGDVDHFWEQAIANKRQKLDPSESLNRSGHFGATTFPLPLELRRDLTVGEIWKEKKNVVIVGDAESSFIMYCMVAGTCSIFNTRMMQVVPLEPGCRLVGLDAQYFDHNGKVTLQANRCADVIIPDTPDSVLTSCGVVLLYQDPHSSSLQVLLKRYLSSQAFVNVAAALAQYFRRRTSGRHVWLDVASLTEHIRNWMLEEVQNIATMNKEALQHVFSYMWKFNKRWCSVLDPPLPLDLQSLKATAADELARRQASGVHHSEDFYHPWGLPKGNFKHRMLSTGLFIEPAADCAVRELKEETGIKLDVDEVKNCPQIDLLQTDNFNPHKGDTVKYFLYVYSPDSIEDEFDVSQEEGQLNTSIEFDTEKSIDEVEDSFAKCLPLDMSTVQETNEKEEDGKNAKDMPEECGLNVVKNHSETLTADQEQFLTNMVQIVTRGTDEAPAERQGVKRKRGADDDDDDQEIYGVHKAPEESRCSLPEKTLTPNKCDTSHDSVTTPTSASKQEVIMAKSPHVQGSVHEECAWFSVEEARLKSPVFEQIYQTKQFRELLNSILAPEAIEER